MSNALSDQQVIQERNDLEMLRRKHLWPHRIGIQRGVSVKKRTDSGLQTGICFEVVNDDNALVIMVMTPEAEKNVRIPFPDAEHVVLDGWVVD